MSVHDSLHSPHNQCADMQYAGSDGTRANRKQFGVFCACRWQRCCCLYGTETSACPRFMGTVGQDTAHPLTCAFGAPEIKCNGNCEISCQSEMFISISCQ